MSHEPDAKLNEPPTHSTIYSDGIIIKPEGNLTCRLIFFERLLKPDNKNIKNFEDQGEKSIQFEVRVPMDVIGALYHNLSLIKNDIQNRNNPSKKHQDIPRLEISNMMLDTDKIYSKYGKGAAFNYLGWTFDK